MPPPQGGNLVIIGSYAGRLTVSMVTPGTIHSPAQLRGKRLGIQTAGAFREVMTRMILAGAGLTPVRAHRFMYRHEAATVRTVAPSRRPPASASR